jgi:phosphoglucomutase
MDDTDYWTRYFKNGAQINTPMDVEIAQSIDSNLEPWPNAWNSLEATEYLHAEALQTILPRYTEAVWNYAVRIMPPSFGIID